ncbi:MAG TPA: hypothetical protein VJV03_04345, partial [Pyrinomonadaceae bacterium]|nr:hypothetical protein [Pyrinomonadaceae bacterium]
MRVVVSLLLLSSLLFMNIPAIQAQTKPAGGDTDLARKIRRFAPTELTASTAHLSPNDKKALAKIIEAAKLMDPLFLHQVWSGNEALKKKLEADKTPAGQLRLHYFLINDGPWSRIDNKEPFIDGVPHEKPAMANHYPEDVTKEEFNAWVESLPEPEKQKATGFFYLIRRDANGKLMTVPYSKAYAEYLVPAAKLLREAAALTTNQTLKNFLNKRAEAFGTDDYYASDVAWMELDSPIDV